jgi:pyruvate kinase
MALFWGVTPLVMPEFDHRDQLRAFDDDWCRAHGLIASGDLIDGIRSALPGDPGHNEIVVREIP